MGQHFLADPNIARKIAESLTRNQQYTIVLEVGPGTGMLSQFLMGKPGLQWIGVELDSESVNFLTTNYPDYAASVIEADFLHVDPEKILAGQHFALIGNFPYHISSQIIFKVLQHRSQIPEVVGMLQKEVAERIAAKPGSKTYGILSVLTQAYYHVKLLFSVPPHVFIPPPKVRSAVLRFERKENIVLDCDEILFFKVVKTAFNQRRKTLRNSLKTMSVAWDKLPVDFPQKRPEQLSVSDFVEITRNVTV